MSQSDRPSQRQCPVADCDWLSRTTGRGLQRHITNTHGKQMPCGDYVPEGNGNGNGNKGQDQVKEHLDNCPRCPRDSKDSPGDDNDRSSAGTPEPGPSVGNGNTRQGRVKENPGNCPRFMRDSKDSSGDDTDLSSAGTPESRPRVGSNTTSTQPAIEIKEMTVHVTANHSLIVSQTNIHTA